MALEFAPKPLELIQRGATAGMLLDAQKELCGACVEEVLKKIDHLVTNNMLDANTAVGLIHEIAAFRRIVQRQQNHVQKGEMAERRLAQEQKP